MGQTNRNVFTVIPKVRGDFLSSSIYLFLNALMLTVLLLHRDDTWILPLPHGAFMSQQFGGDLSGWILTFYEGGKGIPERVRACLASHRELISEPGVKSVFLAYLTHSHWPRAGRNLEANGTNLAVFTEAVEFHGGYVTCPRSCKW